MNTTIEFYRKDIYGVTMYYVANDCERVIVSKLTGRKTLNKQDMACFEEMGFTLTEVLAPRK